MDIAYGCVPYFSGGIYEQVGVAAAGNEIAGLHHCGSGFQQRNGVQSVHDLAFCTQAVAGGEILSSDFHHHSLHPASTLALGEAGRKTAR